MRIESVRDLKAELTAGFQEAGVAESFAALGAVAVHGGRAVRHVSRRSGSPPPQGVVLGVAPSREARKDGHRLAVRFQAQSEDAVRFGHYVMGRSRGEADIQFIGQVFAAPAATQAKYQKNARPLRNGYSIGHHAVTAGTIGGFVKNAAGKIGVLSNNHVLGNINDAKKGDHIVQRGTADGGKVPNEVVGAFARLIKLLPKGNKVDAAWAIIEPEFLDATRFKDYAGKQRGSLVKADAIVRSENVWKVGRTTGLTRGKITAIELDGVAVDYPVFGTASFDGQFEITGDTGPFSLPGDSGSFILGEENRTLGLLFGGSAKGGPSGSGRTFANPLETVLRLLRLKLA